VQATRDGTLNHNDATYIMAYISSPQTVTLNTGVMAAHELKVSWFNPATGASEVVHKKLANPGSLTLEKRPQADWVVVIEAIP
jgi:hypothetical protein